jgi:NADH-quinone oxidoreductase subunit G
MRPGLADPAERGFGAGQIAEALAEGELSALVLFQADPLRTHPDRLAWERALDAANFVVAFSDFVNESIEEHADVVFPAEAYPEKEGTVTHPDGRVQRLRQTIGRPGEVRQQWHVLLDLVSGLLESSPFDHFTGPVLSSHVFDCVPFYGGLTLDEIGGRGIRWQERDSASQLPTEEVPGDDELELPPALPDGLRVGIRSGDEVLVGVNGTRVKAIAAVRTGMPEGSVFLTEGTTSDNATALTNGVPQTVEIHTP